MRPLHEFGSWNEKRDGVVSNQYRGDIHEGSAAVFGDTKKFPGIEGFSPGFQKVVKQISLIDVGEIQYFKIFILYRIHYNPEKDFFEKPDSRMKQFGDTAVIIRDYNIFIERYNHVWGKVFRAEIIKDTLFDRTIKIGEDLKFVFDVIEKSKKIKLLSCVGYIYPKKHISNARC